MAEPVEGYSECSLVSELENKLAVGSVLSSLEDAYLLYCRYALAKGFSVKKGDQRYFSGTNELQAKEFECSSEGNKDEKRSKGKIACYRKPSARTGCKARLRVVRERGGEWTVGRFVTEHNHEMVDSDQAYLLRSSRCILSYAQKATSEAMVNAGISIAEANEKEAQSPQFLLQSAEKDADSVVTCSGVKRQTKVEDGDTSSLLHHFIDRSNKEPFFYWKPIFDDENRVMNFFFRDYKCRTDYRYFGDVLTLDTAHVKFGLTCVSFVGFNHHKQKTSFGLGFLSDETEDSYKWLFRTFLESMDSKQPETVFSNTCQPLMNAIDEVFANSHCRLCQWHVNQKAASNLGSLNGDATLKQLWNRCMNSCESEEEFDCVWRGMIEIYGLHDHKWLKDMYELRHKWSTAFSNHKFSAGVLTIPRTEWTKSKRERENSSETLIDLVRNYENVQTNWRLKERTEDSRCTHLKPAMIVKNNPMLTQVSDLYTLTMYSVFESEFVGTLNTVVKQMESKGSETVFAVDESLQEGSRAHRVVFDRARTKVQCSCLKFESAGILCRHALKVLDLMHVIRMPQCYVKSRWMKKRVEKRTLDVCNESDMVFVERIMMSVYDLAMKCKSRGDARKILVDILEAAYEQANGFSEQLTTSEVVCEDNNDELGR